MKLWIDDVRPAPNLTYVWVKSVDDAKTVIVCAEMINLKNAELTNIPVPIEFISVDHDAGEYANNGGDYIKLLDWLEETGRSYPIHIHSANPVGVQNMRRIIQRNGWKEVK